VQAIVARAAGLRLTVVAEQHSSAWLAPLCGQRSGQQFGLVVAPAMGATATGGRPGNDVDLGGIEPATELLGQVPGEPTAISELQPNDEFLGEAGELGRGNDTHSSYYWR
jgi:hypothetical protein